jgi:hypothetical protein
MSLIKIPLGAFLQSSVGALAKRVLISLGIGVVTWGGVSTAINQFIDYAHAAYSGLPAYASAFLGLSGVGTGLGMVAGALTFRAAYMALPRLGVLPDK